MAPGRDDDFDWLYGRDRSAAQPEPTRVLPAPPTPTAEPTSAAPTWTEPPPSRLAPPPTPGGPRPPPARGPGAARSPGTRSRRGRIALIIVGAVLGVILLWLVAVPIYAWSLVGRVDATPTGARPADQPGTTFLLVGSDSRAGLSAADRKRLGTGASGGQRTDTIMLLSIPPGGRPALISVPRDSYVAIPGHGKNKINAAYAFGGAKLLVQTIEQDTGLRVDGYTEIGFGGFASLIDALGGISVCLPKAIKDADSHLDLPAGCQTLDGTNALGYVRMRKADPRGDLGRVERQRQMLGAVAKEAASPLTLLNPLRYWSVLTSAASGVAIGQDTSFWSCLVMANAMRAVAGGGGLTLTVPISDPNASTPAGSAVLWDSAKAKAMFADLARGDTSGLEKYAN